MLPAKIRDPRALSLRGTPWQDHRWGRAGEEVLVDTSTMRNNWLGDIQWVSAHVFTPDGRPISGPRSDFGAALICFEPGEELRLAIVQFLLTGGC